MHAQEQEDNDGGDLLILTTAASTARAESPIETILPVQPQSVENASADRAIAQADPVEEDDAGADLTADLTAVLPLSRTVNVLVMGSDRRPNMPNWRTDVLMILAMDLENGRAGVVSIPRDVFIDVIPNHQPNRVNVIDYLGERDEPDGGGPALLAGILEEKMGIPIHHYLRFDFEGFKQVIDALGGLEITTKCVVSDYLPEEDIYLSLAPGTHRLTGKQALAYVRSRRQGGDLDRARRQQHVLWAVRDQILRENMVSRVPALYAALHDSVQTDVSLVRAIRYVRFAMDLEGEHVHGLVLAPPDLLRAGWRYGMSVFIADWDLISEEVQLIFERPPLLDSEANAEDGQKFYCE